jgi:hypothetical protein
VLRRRNRASSSLLLTFLIIALALFLLPGKSANAFCGFYVNTGGERLFNEASRVVIMRVGMRTVLSLQNDYKGPLENFALVVPVPIVLEKTNVKTLPTHVFNHVDKLTSPRLVEYWEQDPCPYQREEEQTADNKEGGTGTRAKGEEGSMGAPRPLVKVEAEFSVDEYDIVVLSALDSGALETWLRDNKYVIPAGAEPYLRPYVLEGSKFFVARVDASRVRLSWGRAQLSPLRFFYDTPAFTLPTRLGLINSGGVQDLLIYMLGETRFESANYENIFIPTNLTVKDEARVQFNAFYASLFDQTIAKHPHSVVTEYAWAPSNCDPCPAGAGPLSDEDMNSFGADVVEKLKGQYVLTRLHARYGKDAAGDDLVFKAAPGVVGGREERSWDAKTKTDTLSRDPVVGDSGSASSFQGRYIIRHAWTGPVKCLNPTWGVWGGPRGGGGSSKPTSKAPPTSPFARRDLDASQFILDQEVERHVVQGGAGSGGGRSSVGTFFRRMWQRIEGFTSADNKEKAHVWLLIATPIIAGVLARRRKVGVLSSLGLIVLTILVANVAARLIGGVQYGRFTSSKLLERMLVSETLTTIGIIVGAIGVILQRRAAVSIPSAPNTPSTLRSIGLLFMWSVAPILFAIIECSNQGSLFDGILAEDVMIAFDQRTRIAVEMASEILEPMTLSLIRSSVLLCLAAVFVVRVIRIDPVDRRWSVPVVAAGVAIASHVLVVGLKSMDSSDVGSIVVLVIAAIAIEHVDVRRLGGPATFLALTVAVLLIDLAAKNRNLTVALGSLSGESIDPSQKARILAEMNELNTKRVVLAIVDVALVVSLVLYRIKRTKAVKAMPLLRWVETRWGLISTATIGVLLVGALTMLGWSRSIERVTALESVTRHLGWRKGDPQVPALSPHAEATIDFVAGPALLVDAADKVVFATPGPGKTPKPLTPDVYASMAQAGAESDAPLILVLRGGGHAATFENVLAALQPLLAGKQNAFRLFPDPSESERNRPLGEFRAIVTLSGFDPAAIDIHERISVERSPGVGSSSIDGFWYLFVLGEDGVISVRDVLRDPSGFRPTSSGREFPQKLKLDGTESGGYGLSERIDVSGNQVNALVVFHPKTSVENAVKAIQVVDRLPVPRDSSFWSSQLPRRTKLFSKMIVSPSADAFRGL